ncbi:hypothetical protein [Campylobacter showae]|uniref:hypothetical protein n=1 Tax=Campylobacter showae TaxID=204 RepID=UPI000F07BF76|nr:hypothetical protein [Campylobacter showae]
MKNSNFFEIKQIIQSFEKNTIWNYENCKKAVDFYIELLAVIENQIGLLRSRLDEKNLNIVNNNNDLVMQEIDFFTKTNNVIINAFLKATGKRPQEVRACMVANNYDEKKLPKDIVGISTSVKTYIYG